MPHKHTRKGDDKSTVDLPPTTIARPLSVSKSSKANGIFTTDTSSTSDKRKSNKRKRNADKTDDTPRAFARLMAFREGKKLPKGLDDGVRLSKKSKKAKGSATESSTPGPLGIELASKDSEQPAFETPTIRPGERLAEFSARVDAALPVSGLINKTTRGGKDPLGIKVGRTKTEKRMHRMYDEWRQQEQKIQEQREEARELAEEADDSDDVNGGVKWKIDQQYEDTTSAKKKKKKKGKKRRVIGEVDDGKGDEDPWVAIARARNEGPRRLNDVAQAPPTLTKVPKEKFKVRGARVEVEDVPKAAGSLRRREELGEVRKSVVESYRAMMKENKEKAANRQ